MNDELFKHFNQMVTFGGKSDPLKPGSVFNVSVDPSTPQFMPSIEYKHGKLSGTFDFAAAMVYCFNAIGYIDHRTAEIYSQLPTDFDRRERLAELLYGAEEKFERNLAFVAQDNAMRQNPYC